MVQEASVKGARALLARAGTSHRDIWIVAADLVIAEYDRHAANVIEELVHTLQRATARLEAARSSAKHVLPVSVDPVVNFGDLGLHGALESLATDLCKQIRIMHADDMGCHARAARRVAKSEAPSSPGKSELADCAIIEHYLALAVELRAQGLTNPIVFVSSNTEDYGKPRAIRRPLDEQFNGCNMKFVTDLAWAAAEI
jgi:hypothetical protein